MYLIVTYRSSISHNAFWFRVNIRDFQLSCVVFLQLSRSDACIAYFGPRIRYIMGYSQIVYCLNMSEMFLNMILKRIMLLLYN